MDDNLLLRSNACSTGVAQEDFSSSQDVGNTPPNYTQVRGAQHFELPRDRGSRVGTCAFVYLMKLPLCQASVKPWGHVGGHGWQAEGPAVQRRWGRGEAVQCRRCVLGRERQVARITRLPL